MIAQRIVSVLLGESADPDYDAAESFYERRSRQLLQLAHELKASGGKGRVSWPKIPAARLKRIWLDYGRTGVVRDEKGLDKIADMMLDNIARLRASTEMMGHTQFDPRDSDFKDEGVQFTDQEWDDWMTEFFTDERGNWVLSDFGLPKLEDIYPKIFNAATAEEKLQWIDRALNVIHQRSDLASLFVEGGSKTLMDIFNQGGYTSEQQPD